MSDWRRFASPSICSCCDGECGSFTPFIEETEAGEDPVCDCETADPLCICPGCGIHPVGTSSYNHCGNRLRVSCSSTEMQGVNIQGQETNLDSTMFCPTIRDWYSLGCFDDTEPARCDDWDKAGECPPGMIRDAPQKIEDYCTSNDPHCAITVGENSCQSDECSGSNVCYDPDCCDACVEDDCGDCCDPIPCEWGACCYDEIYDPACCNDCNEDCCADCDCDEEEPIERCKRLQESTCDDCNHNGDWQQDNTCVEAGCSDTVSNCDSACCYNIGWPWGVVPCTNNMEVTIGPVFVDHERSCSVADGACRDCEHCYAHSFLAQIITSSQYLNIFYGRGSIEYTLRVDMPCGTKCWSTEGAEIYGVYCQDSCDPCICPDCYGYDFCENKPDGTEVEPCLLFGDQCEGTEGGRCGDPCYDEECCAECAEEECSDCDCEIACPTGHYVIPSLVIEQFHSDVGIAIGACCNINGETNGLCVNGVSANECVQQYDGTWLGENTQCAVSCNAAPLGACCVGGGGCVQLGEEECIAGNGSWQGEGTPCPGDC